MKTTIEISDPLLREARKLAEREGVTLRALVERGFAASSPRPGPARHSSCAAPASRAGASGPMSAAHRGTSCAIWPMRDADEIHANYRRRKTDEQRPLHPRIAHPGGDDHRHGADAMTTTDILAAYRDLERDDIQEALHYAADAVRERELPLTVP
jgi:hypothetical protein